MILGKTTTAGLLLFGLCHAALAAPPPLDRPSPPPCCADGRCYPNPWTFGWYETRWRRWPMECMDGMPAGRLGPTRPQGSDIPPYDPPPPDEEDRRAPPPTTPPEESYRGPATNAAPSGTESRTGPGPGGTMSAPRPETLLQPGPPSDPNAPRRGFPPPYVPQGPTPNSINSTGPTSDADPPPGLPFGPAMMSVAPPAREVPRQPATPSAEPAASIPEAASDDPPPSLPDGLAAMTN
jgi:hypothetical protein